MFVLSCHWPSLIIFIRIIKNTTYCNRNLISTWQLLIWYCLRFSLLNISKSLGLNTPDNSKYLRNNSTQVNLPRLAVAAVTNADSTTTVYGGEHDDLDNWWLSCRKTKKLGIDRSKLFYACTRKATLANLHVSNCLFTVSSHHDAYVCRLVRARVWRVCIHNILYSLSQPLEK